MTANHQHVVELTVRLESCEVLRMLGCDRDTVPRPDHQHLTQRLIAQSLPQIRARGVYTVHDVVRMTDCELSLEGCRLVRGPIAGYLKPARRVATFVVTVGTEIEQMAEQRLRDGCRLEGHILHAIGSSAADAAVDALADEIYFRHANPNEALTPPLSPGFCGLPIEEQIPLFTIVDAKAIGVKLLPSMKLDPVKSASGLIGIGRSEDVESHGVPCQWCDLRTCNLRHF